MDSQFLHQTLFSVNWLPSTSMSCKVTCNGKGILILGFSTALSTMSHAPWLNEWRNLSGERLWDSEPAQFMVGQIINYADLPSTTPTVSCSTWPPTWLRLSRRPGLTRPVLHVNSYSQAHAFKQSPGELEPRGAAITEAVLRNIKASSSQYTFLLIEVHLNYTQ